MNNGNIPDYNLTQSLKEGARSGKYVVAGEIPGGIYRNGVAVGWIYQHQEQGQEYTFSVWSTSISGVFHKIADCVETARRTQDSMPERFRKQDRIILEVIAPNLCLAPEE